MYILFNINVQINIYTCVYSLLYNIISHAIYKVVVLLFSITLQLFSRYSRPMSIDEMAAVQAMPYDMADIIEVGGEHTRAQKRNGGDADLFPRGKAKIRKKGNQCFQ